jgi:hypothetical protein
LGNSAVLMVTPSVVQYSPAFTSFQGANMNRNAPALKALILPGTALTVIGCILLTACAHIDVKPKDPQLVAMQEFAEKVAGQLYDRNPSTYVQSQQQLSNEIAPTTLKELKAHGLCAKSAADATAKSKTLKPEGEFKIENSSFLKATDNGLIPVEVKGTAADKTKFDVVLLIGLNKTSKLPLVVSVTAK